MVLAVLAVFSGFWNVNGGFAAFMGEGETKNFFVGLFEGFTHPLPWIALLVAGAGIFTVVRYLPEEMAVRGETRPDVPPAVRYLLE